MQRPVLALYTGQPVLEGAGVHLRRIFGHAEVPAFDPFLMFDDFRSDHPAEYLRGFPWHPHRGIETITYVLTGDVEHGDSLGNTGVIRNGDVQWMTAGSGIIHQEMPRGDTRGRMHGFQLWANLPAGQKMMPPRYRGISAAEIPVVERADGVRVKVISGTVDGVCGPMDDIVIQPEYLDCLIPADQSFSHVVPRGHTVFVYAIAGSGTVHGRAVHDGTLVLYGDGDSADIAAGEHGLRFLLLSGCPLGEPVAWGGPIVMNTQDELDTAFREFRDGTFIKHQPA